MFGVICGSLLIGMPVIGATTPSHVNDRTSITMPVTQLHSILAQAPSHPGSTNVPRTTPRTNRAATPAPEQLQPPSAMVTLVNGTVNIKLVNQTYTNINYQVIGDTKPRTLPGRSDITLRNLKTPTNITFQRPDRGLLQVRPQSTEAGMLEVTMSETTDFSADRTAMTVQANGKVYLN